MTTMPAGFIGHGSPMNSLERNRYTDSWRAFGAAVPTPERRARRLRSLVHQRHRRHGNGSTPHDPRLLRVP